MIRKHVHNYDNIDPEFVKKVLRELYVDDLVSGTHDRMSAFELYQKYKFRFKQAGLELRKWSTNDVILQKERNICEDVVVKLADNVIEEKVLGIRWAKDDDAFLVDLHRVYDTSLKIKSTKWNILKSLASITIRLECWLFLF